MTGGGTIMHQPIGMGANVAGVDIDPIPVVQVRATLTRIPLAHKGAVIEQFFTVPTRHLSPFYRTTCPICSQEAETQFVLYGLRRRCACQEVLSVDSLLLRENRGQDIHICPIFRQVNSGTDRPRRG
jgi:hypothetical protein